MVKYCESVFTTKRWKTREVKVGNVGVGAENPIRIQSMTTSNTRDVEATIGQIIRLADSGCEIARVTVQGIKEAEACEHIKNGLIQRGYMIPLVADIHFYPPAAMKAVEFVDKIRINPGNYSDKRASFKVIEYDDDSYVKELSKIEEKFAPLIEKCKYYKKAMRIGTNHGSLSDRIMNRYGDTPRGMIESALEFAHLCRKYEYHDFVFSMKASNPIVMIQAYRLLVAEMYQLGWNYPLHLGVTEAGEGEDGRIKSAMGIGSLLLDGLGDTIRVSLTEDPWYEIDPCQRLVQLAQSYQGKGVQPFMERHRHIEAISKRQVELPKNISLHRDGTVMATLGKEEAKSEGLYRSLGCGMRFGEPKLERDTVDALFVESMENERIGKLEKAGISLFTGNLQGPGLKIYPLKEISLACHAVFEAERYAIPLSDAQNNPLVVRIGNSPKYEWKAIENAKPALIILSPVENRLHFCREFFDWLKERQLGIPVILNFKYECSKEDLPIRAAAELGALLTDGLGEGIWIEGDYELDYLRNLSFGILQSARMRIIKTDFISCPSCGRTLFNLQEVTKKIRDRTSHLPGVKIAIMGCIVNGPGEMADADFGYVGSKPGMIDLYVGKECVEKDISFDSAVEKLVELIKKHGRWVEPEVAAEQESCRI